MSKDVITYFEDDSGEPLLGLTPTIRIRNVADNSLIVTDASMGEIGDGGYKYDFTSYDSTINYFIRCDAGIAINGRYNAISSSQDLENSISTILSDIEDSATGLIPIKNTVQELLDIEGGRWKIDQETKQMIFYKADNITEVFRFNLKDENGNPSASQVLERVRV